MVQYRDRIVKKEAREEVSASEENRYRLTELIMPRQAGPVREGILEGDVLGGPGVGENEVGRDDLGDGRRPVERRRRARARGHRVVAAGDHDGEGRGREGLARAGAVEERPGGDGRRGIRGDAIALGFCMIVIIMPLFDMRVFVVLLGL